MSRWLSSRKCPPFKRWISASGRSRRNASAPAGAKISSLRPQTASSGTAVRRKRRSAADFVRAVGASAELARWSVLAQVLVEWKATATIYADPVLVEELTRPLDEDLGPGDDGAVAVRGDRGWPDLC